MADISPSTDIWQGLAAEPDYPLWLPRPKGAPPLAMLFRRIPAGSFVMGSRGENAPEEPRHRVVIAPEFWLGKFVVTQAEYRSVVEGMDRSMDGGLDAAPSHFKGDRNQRHPVESVSWDDVTAWCEALARWPGLPAHIREVRLPTEAEWEYACRAGTDTDYHNGDGEAALAEVGWYDGNSGKTTHPVDERVSGTPEQHPAGLVGLHGNVWEWCQDVWDPMAYRKRPDPWDSHAWALENAGKDATHYDEAIKPGEAPDRVVRGGSWDVTAGRCRSAFRFWRWPVVRSRFRGFRVCLVPGPASPVEAPRAPGVGGRGTRPETDEAGGAGASENPDLAHSRFSGEAGRDFLPEAPRP